MRMAPSEATLLRYGRIIKRSLMKQLLSGRSSKGKRATDFIDSPLCGLPIRISRDQPRILAAAGSRSLRLSSAIHDDRLEHARRRHR